MTVKKQTGHVTVSATIDGKIFTRFALFDTFIMKKRWRNPAAFTGIMTIFAAVCFLSKKTHEQAGLLGTVLLSCALVLPAVWFFLFMVSVRNQIKANGLSDTKAQYFVMLSNEKIRVVKGDEQLEHVWDEIFHVYFRKDCIYLYISENRAYLLPAGEDAEKAEELIRSHVPAEKITVKE